MNPILFIAVGTGVAAIACLILSLLASSFLWKRAFYYIGFLLLSLIVGTSFVFCVIHSGWWS